MRDPRSDTELVFTALVELSARQIAEAMQAKGLKENKVPAKKGGRRTAGEAAGEAAEAKLRNGSRN